MEKFNYPQLSHPISLLIFLILLRMCFMCVCSWDDKIILYHLKSYLLHRIVDNSPRILKGKIINLKPVFLAIMPGRPVPIKLVLILKFYI